LLLNAFSVQEHEISLELDNPIEQVVITLPFSTSDVIYYFVAPDEYLGNKVTAYGGKLQYTLEYTKGRSDVGTGVLAADVILIGNNISVAYEHNEQAVDNIPLTIEVDLREWIFRHWTGAPVTWEQMMVLLLNLDKIYIRAQYNTEVNEARFAGLDEPIGQVGIFPVGRPLYGV